MRVNRRRKTETPRLEPGRSIERKYCITTVMQVKLKLGAKERKVKTRTLRTAGCGTQIRPSGLRLRHPATVYATRQDAA